MLENLTFRDLDLRERFEPCRGERRLNDYHPLIVPDATELVYKVADATERDLLQTNPGFPKRDVKYEHTQPQMREIDGEEATRRVLSGEPGLVRPSSSSSSSPPNAPWARVWP